MSYQFLRIVLLCLVMTAFGTLSFAQEVTPQNQEANAALLRLDLGDGVILECAPIPAGSAFIGSPETEYRRSGWEFRHEVTFPNRFYMGVYEVTQEQWEKVMGNNPSRFVNPKNPVDRVNWDEAVEFCERVSAITGRKVRLPTEYEWEYAARAGTDMAFSFGDAITAADANYRSSTSYGNAELSDEEKKALEESYRAAPLPVGSFKPNAWGLYDVHGNVMEWCADEYKDYPGARVRLAARRRNPELANADEEERDDAESEETPRRLWETVVTHILRGGAWNSPPEDCRSASRARRIPSGQNRFNFIGFRVVVE